MNTILAFESFRANGDIAIRSSFGNTFVSANPQDILSHLAEQARPSQLMVSWDLNRFLSPIFELLPRDCVEKLNSGERAIWGPFRLFFSVGKGKYFGITYRKLTQIKDNNFHEDKYDINIYELKTFFPGEQPPSTINGVAAQGQRLLSVLYSMGFEPTKLTSPASVYEECILRRIPMPNIFNMPEDFLPMQEKCWNYIREWRSVYKIGIWPEGSVWDYDLSSAYPSIIARLPNLSHAEFIHTPDGSIPPRYTWGIIDGIVIVNKDISPLVAPDGTCRKGEYPDLISTEEWNFINRWEIGDFKPKEGWFFLLPYNHQCLFEYSMRRLYQQRQSHNPLQNSLAKAMSVSVWGKMQETHNDKYGDYCNFIYACMTASRTRLKVADFIYTNCLCDDLISVTVDGCLAEREAIMSEPSGFGKWRANPPSPAMVLSSSYQWVGDKRPNNHGVNYMIEAAKTHPKSTRVDSIFLAALDCDREFQRLPHTCRDLFSGPYTSKPFAADFSMENLSH